jgi:hypothetical protein
MIRLNGGEVHFFMRTARRYVAAKGPAADERGGTPIKKVLGVESR